MNSFNILLLPFKPIFFKMKNWLFILFLALHLSSYAQVSGSEALSLPVVGIHYGGAFSGADLAERYGYFNRVGLTAGYKFKSNWSVGLESDFWFSDNVKITGLFDHLVDGAGNITNDLGLPGSVPCIRAVCMPMRMSADYSHSIKPTATAASSCNSVVATWCTACASKPTTT